MRKLVSGTLGLAAAAMSVGVVASVACPILYRDVVFGGTTPDSASAAVPVIVDGSAAAIADTKDVSGAWELGSGSYAGYSVDVALNGTDRVVSGQTEKVSGSMTIDGQNLTSTTVT